jgi:CubicO group peptidase (beta-lactamase class C family)
MRKRRLLVLSMTLAAGLSAAAEPDACSYRRTTPSRADAAGSPVTRNNWLAVEHLRVGLSSPERFMPGVAMRSAGRGPALSRAEPSIDIDRITAVDPDDGSEKSLRFLLETRLYTDGIIVLSGEQIVLEYYGPGFEPGAARLLLQGTRAFLTTLLAASADRGRYSREKSVVRLLPDLAKEANLRKTSVQRLIDGRSGLMWSPEDRRQWLAATGWAAAATRPSAGLRAWFKARKSWPRDDALPVSEMGGPEGELLVWMLENASKQSVSRVFCESVLSAIGAEDEAFWATDPAGTELADGLALSLRDLARFGLALINARIKAGTGPMAPKWFAESLASAVTRSDPPPAELDKLGEDSAWRYRFLSLGRAHQAAIVGPFGNSLFMDFDRKIVVAIFASFPKDYSPLALTSLRNVWSAIARAIPPKGR